MAKVVGLSGAQGAGKSTLLVELQHRGWELDQFRVSRSVQAEFGWKNLDQVLESPWTMIKFQEEVFRQKYNHDLALNSSTHQGIILTERTFADIYAYTQGWMRHFLKRGELNETQANSLLDEFGRRCEVCQNEVYSGVLLLPLMDHIDFEVDPNRAKEETAQQMFNDTVDFVNTRMNMKTPRLMITEQSVGGRAFEVESFLKAL